MYLSSKHKVAIPVPTAPVILETELKAPYSVLVTKLEAPFMIPNPPSKGPLTNPSAGFSNKSLTPVLMLLNSPIGLPIKLRLPTIFRN